MLPKFSCCGFTYVPDADEEPKTHIVGKSYVHFYVSSLKGASENFELLKLIIRKSGWKLYQPFCHNNDPLIDISYSCPTYDNLYTKLDGIKESIHQYEPYVLSIAYLTYMIQEHVITVNDPVYIIDGNSLYSPIKEWQIKPKKSFMMSISKYYNTYGKQINPNNLQPQHIKYIQCSPININTTLKKESA